MIRISDFIESKTGDKSGNISTKDWFFISEQFLLEATNGKLFYDNLGLFTEIRENPLIVYKIIDWRCAIL